MHLDQQASLVPKARGTRDPSLSPITRMAGGPARVIVLALAVSVGGSAAVAASITDPAAARRVTTTPPVAAIAAELDAHAEQKRPDAIAAKLELIAHDRSLPDVAQEWLIDRALHALARLEPTLPARVTVERLTGRAPVVYAHIDPDHGDRVTPLYDAGATARFVLRTWDRRAAGRTAHAELRAGRTSAVARFAARAAAGAADPVRAGIADAFASARIADLGPQRATIVDAIGRGERVDELALILAERLADHALFRLVFGHADETVALAAIPRAANVLDPQSALEALGLASQRADIASAAVLAIGRLARNDSIARSFLLDALADPAVGPSAAAALAGLGDATVSAELGRRLAAARTEDERRVLVLALKLDHSAGARAELERFGRTGAGSTQLRREVRQWLAH